MKRSVHKTRNWLIQVQRNFCYIMFITVDIYDIKRNLFFNSDLFPYIAFLSLETTFNELSAFKSNQIFLVNFNFHVFFFCIVFFKVIKSFLNSRPFLSGQLYIYYSIYNLKNSVFHSRTQLQQTIFFLFIDILFEFYTSQNSSSSICFV